MSYQDPESKHPVTTATPTEREIELSSVPLFSSSSSSASTTSSTPSSPTNVSSTSSLILPTPLLSYSLPLVSEEELFPPVLNLVDVSTSGAIGDGSSLASPRDQREEATLLNSESETQPTSGSLSPVTAVSSGPTQRKSFQNGVNTYRASTSPPSSPLPSSASSSPSSSRFKLTPCPLPVPSHTLADLLFPVHASKILSYIDSQRFITGYTVMASCGWVIIVLTLFDFIDHRYIAFFGLTVFGSLAMLLTVNLEMYRYLLRTFDFWWVGIQNGAWVVLTCFVLGDARIWIVIISGFHSFTFGHIDCFPEKFRKLGFSLWAMNGLAMIAHLLLLHFRIIPRLQDYEYSLYGTRWSVIQMSESTEFGLIVWVFKFALFSFFCPGDAIVLKANVRRTDKQEAEKVTGDCNNV